jgi:hypothetical protein
VGRRLLLGGGGRSGGSGLIDVPVIFLDDDPSRVGVWNPGFSDARGNEARGASSVLWLDRQAHVKRERERKERCQPKEAPAGREKRLKPAKRGRDVRQ